MFNIYVILNFSVVIFIMAAILLSPVYMCRGLWMAGYRLGGTMVAAFLVLGFAMEFTEVGRSLFSDNRHVYLITSKSMYLAAGLIATCYAILILRHMLFSKTMPWTGSKED